eukprot:CAMPEP_0196599060 /NCGR_PEP_ID=MMETSP1081-20130531/94657_1 /TAXON_ID=36882 /ORGANISM="Pyramimonas amylifera, Strain CCMP720" /LENGTH=82 /DNA_ID=CAMNT_0041924807 /DNA_START=148 /DNA_END=396 /DNA_ORIENTATION=+
MTIGGESANNPHKLEDKERRKTAKRVQAGEARLERHSVGAVQSPNAKKNGAGGKGTWEQVIEDELEDATGSGSIEVSRGSSA